MNFDSKEYRLVILGMTTVAGILFGWSVCKL